MFSEPSKDDPDQRLPPPVFDPLQAQNKAECAAIWHSYAQEAEQKGDPLGARMGYVNAWRDQPEDFRYFQSFIDYLGRVGKIDELINAYEIGIQLFRDNAATFVNFSDVLNTYGRHARAKEVVEMWLARDPACMPAWGNLGNALYGLGDYSGAQECFEKVLQAAPGNPLATFNLSNIFLAREDYEKGWKLYESRLSLPGYHRLSRRNSAPMWQGESLEDRSILVYAEQGLGDSIMFGRYLRMLAESGARVFLEAQKPVAWMMEDLIGVEVQVIERGSLDIPTPKETDFQIPLLSLPGIAYQRGWEFEQQERYLDPHPEVSPRASELVSALEGIKVGLCWQGNPHAAIDCRRSIPLEAFAPLMELQTVEFVSLQARDGLEGIESFAGRWRNFHHLTGLDEKTRAYEETVLLMENMDLVITSDTAIAHLAGALGKVCWVILQKYPEWRWGLENESTPWYPRMRLFRQDTPDDWGGAIRKVKASLANDFPLSEG